MEETKTVMNGKLRTRIISGIIFGIVTALCNAGFDYIDNQNFNTNKFIILTLINGIIGSIIVRTNHKN